MDIRPEFYTPYAPRVVVQTEDGEEAKLINAMSDNLRAMQSECERLVSDIALFGFCHQEPQATLRDWMFLAGRDGAMALRNFKEALSAVRGLVGRCPSVSNDINAAALKAAENEFDAKFPRAKKLRHSVAHPEHYANPGIKMSTDEPIDRPEAKLGAGTTVQGSLFGQTFLSTINGLTVQYDITGETALQLVKITKDAFAAFARLDPFAQPTVPSQPSPD